MTVLRAADRMNAPAWLGSAQLEQRCTHCSGYGMVRSPAWLNWESDMARWRDRNGIAGPVQGETFDRFVGEYPMPDCDEENPCPECEGSGWLLTADGFALLGFLRRHKP